MPAPINILGKTFGSLKVIADAPVHRYPNGRSGRMVVCQCECGKTVTVFNQALLGGLTRSCGCKQGSWRHGQAPRQRRSRAYEAWLNMKARCYDPNAISYPNYGGRGIVVHPDWINDFMAFYREVGDPPPGTTLGRIRNEGNYEPGNVRWETRSQQMRNTRANHLVTVDGITSCVTTMCERFHISRKAVYHRLKVGWPVELAFKTPSGRGKRGPRPKVAK